MAVITPQTAAINARNSHASRRANSYPNAIKSIGQMQDRLKSGVLDPDTPLREQAQAACAWDKLEARKAILRGRPANTSQSIREPREKKQSKSSAGPLESLPESKPE